MAPASITASTGRPKRSARSAALGSPSYRPITPSTMSRSACCAAACRRARQSASPVIHRSSWYTGAPLASACQNGSRKSGPHLNTRTRRPWRACSLASAAVIVVLPCPEAGAVTSTAGQRATVPWLMSTMRNSYTTYANRGQARRSPHGNTPRCILVRVSPVHKRPSHFHQRHRWLQRARGGAPGLASLRRPFEPHVQHAPRRHVSVRELVALVAEVVHAREQLRVARHLGARVQVP